MEIHGGNIYKLQREGKKDFQCLKILFFIIYF